MKIRADISTTNPIDPGASRAGMTPTEGRTVRPRLPIAPEFGLKWASMAHPIASLALDTKRRYRLHWAMLTFLMATCRAVWDARISASCAPSGLPRSARLTACGDKVPWRGGTTGIGWAPPLSVPRRRGSSIVTNGSPWILNWELVTPPCHEPRTIRTTLLTSPVMELGAERESHTCGPMVDLTGR